MVKSVELYFTPKERVKYSGILIKVKVSSTEIQQKTFSLQKMAIWIFLRVLETLCFNENSLSDFLPQGFFYSNSSLQYMWPKFQVIPVPLLLREKKYIANFFFFRGFYVLSSILLNNIVEWTKPSWTLCSAWTKKHQMQSVCISIVGDYNKLRLRFSKIVFLASKQVRLPVCLGGKKNINFIMIF